MFRAHLLLSPRSISYLLNRIHYYRDSQKYFCSMKQEHEFIPLRKYLCFSIRFSLCVRLSFVRLVFGCRSLTTIFIALPSIQVRSGQLVLPPRAPIANSLVIRILLFLPVWEILFHVINTDEVFLSLLISLAIVLLLHAHSHAMNIFTDTFIMNRHCPSVSAKLFTVRIHRSPHIQQHRFNFFFFFFFMQIEGWW